MRCLTSLTNCRRASPSGHLSGKEFEFEVSHSGELVPNGRKPLKIRGLRLFLSLRPLAFRGARLQLSLGRDVPQDMAGGLLEGFSFLSAEVRHEDAVAVGPNAGRSGGPDVRGALSLGCVDLPCGLVADVGLR